MKFTSTIISRIASLALLGTLTTSASADVVETRSGEIIEGRFMGGSQETVRMDVAGKTRVLKVADIVALSFDARPAAPAQPQVIAAPAAATTQTTVPAGTSLLVRLRDPIDSNRQGSGHRFTAVLEGNLTARGQVVAHQGATVYGQILSSKRAGRLVGKSEMTITLTGISIGGNIVSIVTGDATAATDGTARNTAGKVGRGAAIGALAGGSKGAKKGAKFGAGAAILTRGASLRIPPGTLLDFRLTQSLTM